MTDTRSLALELRPKTFADFIGSADTIKALRAKLEAGVFDVGYLFAGPTGVGKTSLAWLVAEAARGVPIDPLDQDFIEHNAADLNGVNAARDLVESTRSYPMSGKYRVIILNECHKLTDPAQNVLLQPLENKQTTTTWIFTTTEPQSLLKTLRDRCAGYYLRPFGPTERSSLLLRAVGGKDYKALAAAITQADITSGREILNVCERWLGGMSPDDAVSSPGSESSPLYTDIAKAVLNGNWPKVNDMLERTKSADGKGLKSVLAAFASGAMCRDDGKRGDVLESALGELGRMQGFEDGINFHVLKAFMRKLSRSLKNA